MLSELLNMLLDRLGLWSHSPELERKTASLRVAATVRMLVFFVVINITVSLALALDILRPLGWQIAFALPAWIALISVPMLVKARLAAATAEAGNRAWQLELLLFGIALGWAVATITLLPQVDYYDRVRFLVIVSGILVLGTITGGFLPRIGFVWLFLLASVILHAEISGIVPVTGLIIAAFVVCCVYLFCQILIFGAIFRSHAEAALVAEEHAEAVGGRLGHLEDKSADWLWETDALGRLTYASPRLLEILDISQEAARRLDFFRLLFDEPPGGSERGEADDNRAALALHLERRITFDNCTISITIPDHDRTGWWRLAGQPKIGSDERFEGWTGVGTDVTLTHQKDHDIELIANFDSLTGLANRKRFNVERDGIEPELKRGEHIGILLFDIDRFKDLNESQGHRIGDIVLYELASRLRALVGPPHFPARSGGDSFAVIIRAGTDGRQALALAHRVVTALSEPVVKDNRSLQMRISFGLAVGPIDGTTGEDLQRRADLALDHAKAGGGNRLVVFDPILEAQTRERTEIIRALPSAVNNRELVLHYQPWVDVRTQTVIGFEALVRWNHPTLGLLQPGSFIAIAEETGTIVEIGAWVIRQACRDAMELPDGTRMSVNISVVQLLVPDLVEVLREALASSGLAPSRLELEITESALLKDIHHTNRQLAAFRALGCSIALDDFGTGYSSLSYLRTFDFDCLKIDRSFLTNREGTGDPRSILWAIVFMARALGLETVCEGIETREQMELLQRFGVTIAQGYGISVPLPLAAIPAFLDMWQNHPVSAESDIGDQHDRAAE